MLRRLFSVCLLIGANGSEAGIYDDCIIAISQGETATVERLASTIRRFNDISVRDVNKAETCVTAAEGVPHRYLSRSNEFLPDADYGAALEQAMLDAAKQEKEREEKERQMRELAERVRQQVIEEEAIKAENTALISRDVYLACNKLFSSNMVQAMTNEICLASFRVNGHPELGRPMPKE